MDAVLLLFAEHAGWILDQANRPRRDGGRPDVREPLRRSRWHSRPLRARPLTGSHDTATVWINPAGIMTRALT
jgi:hypothetical protein